MYVYTYVYKYVCMYACMCVCMHVYMYVYIMHVYMYACTCMYICIYVCMYVCIIKGPMYVCTYVCIFHKKSNDNFYHIKHNTGLYVTSVTCTPRHIFEKKHNYLLLQWSSYIIRNILFISTCHYATNTRNMTTGCRTKNNAYSTLRKISPQKKFICRKFVRKLKISTPSPLHL